VITGSTSVVHRKYKPQLTGSTTRRSTPPSHPSECRRSDHRKY